MTNYLFIETCEPFESRDTQFVVDTALSLKEAGHQVTVFLVQNGVLATRKKSSGSKLDRLLSGNISVMADDYSLRERGILGDELLGGIETSDIEALVDLLIKPNTKAIWH